ncbi:MAG: SDR family NAD(P)-dependent oxidoreductase [Chloroflexia bacterium]|nr:SDR family NAD(P)-dependent oxidoreductase [Chloroflexia bacterium]
MHTLTGNVVVLTGASAGIGAATARAFAQAGAHLVLVARSPEPLTHLVASLPGTHLMVPTDVADPVACHSLISQAVNRYGPVDLLINNAGVGLSGPVSTLDHDDLTRTLAVNLFGPLALMQAVLPVMRARGSGHIINVSTVLAVQTLPYLGGYAAAKAGLERLSDALRMELQGSGIKVSLVRPGTTRTAFSQHRLGKGGEQRRFASPGVGPEVVARTILRVARRPARVTYVTVGDRIGVIAASLFPSLIERILGKAIGWKEA